MEPSKPTELGIRELVDRFLDGTLDEFSRARLEKLLREDKAALAYYLEVTGNEALLGAALAEARAEEEKAKPRREGWLVNVAAHRGAWLALAASIVLLAVAAAVWFPKLRPGSGAVQVAGNGAQPAAAVPARITGLIGVRTSGKTDLRLAARPPEARIAFEAGLLELTLDQGATVLLQGPAEIEVTGANSCRLTRGRLVANVPPQAHGFTVNYRDGKLVDHGTEFAMDVDASGNAREVGVFRGEVELFEPKLPGGLKLFTDYAVKRAGDGLQDAAFDRERFVREIPAREFAWDMRGTAIETAKDFLHDITPLMHGPGEFRVIFRHLAGGDHIDIQRVEIRRDGKVITASDAEGHTSAIHLPGRSNNYRLAVPPAEWRAGRWELAFRAKSPRVDDKKRGTTARGIVCFEEGLSVQAEPENFIGMWAYSNNSATYVRDIRPDGTVVLFRNGKLVSREAFDGRWKVADNVLEITYSNGATPEKHCLRDINTLIFLSRSYRNAHRVQSVGG